MGGDTPLDFECEIYSICGAQMFYEGNKIMLSHLEVEANMPAIIEMLEKEADPVGWQVLAVLGMECGVTFSDEIKNRMLQACDEDEWAQEDKTRKQKVDELKKTITAYNTQQFQSLEDILGPVEWPNFNPQTEEEIQKLNDFQQTGRFHPHTCDRRAAECEVKCTPRDYSKDGVLIATKDGWICPCGKYKQPY